MVTMLVMMFQVSARDSILPCLLRQRQSDTSPVSEFWRVVDTGSCELGAARHSGQTGLRERRCRQVAWLFAQGDTLDEKIRTSLWLRRTFHLWFAALEQRHSGEAATSHPALAWRLHIHSHVRVQKKSLMKGSLHYCSIPTAIKSLGRHFWTRHEYL